METAKSIQKTMSKTNLRKIPLIKKRYQNESLINGPRKNILSYFDWLESIIKIGIKLLKCYRLKLANNVCKNTKILIEKRKGLGIKKR
jgi:hypothetical protein